MPGTPTYINLANLGKCVDMLLGKVGNTTVIQESEPSSVDNGTSWIDVDLTIQSQSQNQEEEEEE